jgi:spore coat polysaccharide biosynthesis predicted glycosyltransferase SpsG
VHDDKDLSSHIASIKGVDLILHDYPFDTMDNWHTLKTLGVPIIAIDDDGNESLADLILNTTFCLPKSQYRWLGKDQTLLSGPQYALLRPEFNNAHWVGYDAKKIVCVIGSAQAANDFAFGLIQNVGIFEDASVSMVVGAGFKDIKALKALAKINNIELFQSISANALVSLMTQARLCITTGGMITYESLGLNVPALIFAQMDNMIEEITYVSSQKACIGLGIEVRTLDYEDLKAQISYLYNDPITLMAMSKAQKTLMDTNGTQRAALAILDYLRR